MSKHMLGDIIPLPMSVVVYRTPAHYGPTGFYRKVWENEEVSTGWTDLELVAAERPLPPGHMFPEGLGPGPAIKDFVKYDIGVHRFLRFNGEVWEDL